ncbi:MAG: rRNA maturation RNase YbeY [Candidatus Gracilibacteria bacterium]
MVKIEIFNETKNRIAKAVFQKLAKKAGRILKKNCDLGVLFCGDKKIRELNKKYRKKDKPTDVLSFGYKKGVWSGDIIISLDTAKKQAKEKGHSLEKELEILFVHGMLHVAGFDHETDAEEAKMEKVAAKILN